MKIYIDILFIQHFIINYFLIEMTSAFLREKANKKNKILASTLATMYSIIVIFNNFEYAEGVIRENNSFYNNSSNRI